MQNTVFVEAEAYVLRSQNMSAEYIVTQTILNLFEEVVRCLGVWVSKRWWEQEGLDVEGERVKAEAVDEGEPKEVKGEMEGVSWN